MVWEQPNRHSPAEGCGFCWFSLPTSSEEPPSHKAEQPWGREEAAGGISLGDQLGTQSTAEPLCPPSGPRLPQLQGRGQSPAMLRAAAAPLLRTLLPTNSMAWIALGCCWKQINCSLGCPGAKAVFKHNTSSVRPTALQGKGLRSNKI